MYMKFFNLLINNPYPGKNNRRIRQIMLSMKLIFACLLVGMLSVHAEVLSQVYSLSLKNTPLREVLRGIEQQGDYRFFFSDDVADLNQMVQVNVSNATIDQLLNQVLTPYGLGYQMLENNLIVISPYTSAKQGITVTGTVTDNAGEPMPGVNVLVKGSSVGTVSDLFGRYSISVPDENAVLQFSFVGYTTRESVVGINTTINMTLEEDTRQIEEVVVIGYGTMRKKDLTGSVVQIRPDKIANENPKTVQEILRGTAGLAIGYEPQAKGGGSMQLRGQRSVYTSGSHNEPLIILDGMMFFGDMTEINPDDIEQIDILKDASAAAIYGAQAANGVIIISTKKGKLGRPVVNVSANIGFTTKSAYREMWNPTEYMTHREDWAKKDTYGLNTATGAYEAYVAGGVERGYYEHPDNLAKYGLDVNTWRSLKKDGGGVFLPGATVPGGYNDRQTNLWLYASRLGWPAESTQLLLDNYVAGKTFDWWDHTFRTGINQDYNASVSGASERMNYYLSFGYQKTEGAVINNFFDNIRSNVKVEGKVTDWLEVGANINFQKRSDGDLTPNLDTRDSEAQNNPLRLSPYGALYNDDGSYTQFAHGSGNRIGGTGNFFFNLPYRELDRGYMVLNTIFNAKVKLPFNITYSFYAQPRYQFFHNYYWESSKNPAWTHGGSVNRENSWRFDWSFNNQINWEQTFAQVHRVNVTLVQEAERRRGWMDRINAANFDPSDALGFHNTRNSTKDNTTWNSEDTQHSAAALLGRVFYSYDDRYMLTASLRRDGYSAFGTSNPWAVFPSLAVAWTFTRENFFNFEPMNYGKLRVTWGKNGNRALNDPYVSLANLSTGGDLRYAYVNSAGNTFNFSYLQIDRMANPNLQWEKSAAWNFGLDFGFLKNRISGTIEYYSIATRDMIMEQQLTQFSGFNKMTTNLGEVTNKGIEISLSTLNVKTNMVEWSTTLNFAYNKNRIVHLYYEYDKDGKESNDTGSGWHIGQPIDVIWDYRQTGIWQANEYDQAKDGYGQRPGDPKVQKNPDNPLQKNADGIYNYDNLDRYYLGPRTAPVNWSMRNDVTLFKDLTISFNMYSRMGHKRLTNYYMNNDNASNILVQAANDFKKEYWTPEHPSTKYGRLLAQGPSGATGVQKLHNASFIRFESLSVGYSLPRDWTKRIDIERVKVFGSIRNLGVWCKDWEYGDPESVTSDNNGLGGLATRVFSLGLNVTF